MIQLKIAVSEFAFLYDQKVTNIKLETKYFDRVFEVEITRRTYGSNLGNYFGI